MPEDSNTALSSIVLPSAGEAVSHRILTQELAQLLFLIVALSMALTPFLAELGQKIGKAFDSHDMKARLATHCLRFQCCGSDTVL